MSADTTLHELHRIFQMLFAWLDYHLHIFEIDGEEFEAPHAEARGRDSTKVKLSRLALEAGDSFYYTYDFGDDWRHLIEVESIEPASENDRFPWVIDGERRGPPEDCGGLPGYEMILDLLSQSRAELDEEERATLEWLGEDFDPNEFSINQVRHSVVLASAWGVLKRRS